MSKRYKERYSFEERQAKAKNFQESDADKVMVIVEKHMKSKLPDLQNTKFLTYKHFKFGQVKNLVEKKIKQKIGKDKGQESYFLFVNGTSPGLEETMQSVYEKLKEKDGILYITYQEQLSF